MDFHGPKNGKQEILTSFENSLTPEVENGGSYDAVVYIDRRGELGSGLLLLMYSAEDPPEMENIYYICAETKFWETIDPGQYEAYELCFEADLVSQPPTFKPRDIGNYEVIVTNALGCFSERKISKIPPLGMFLRLECMDILYDNFFSCHLGIKVWK